MLEIDTSNGQQINDTDSFNISKISEVQQINEDAEENGTLPFTDEEEFVEEKQENILQAENNTLLKSPEYDTPNKILNF